MSKDRFPEVQVKAPQPKFLYYESGEWEHPASYEWDTAAESRCCKGEAPQTDPGRVPDEVCDGHKTAFREVLCQHTF